MDKKSTTLAARAIASTLIDRYLLKIVGAVALLLLILVIISLLLAAMFSGWWLVMTVIVLPFALLASAITTLVWYIGSRIAPRKLLKREKQQINQFVDEFSVKMVALKAIQRTPVGLASLVAWKWLRGGGNNSVKDIITEPIKEARSLKDKFAEIAQLFA